MKNSENDIHIGLAFDENFITPVFVLLTSIFKNHLSETLYFHVIAEDVKQETKEEIKLYVRQNGNEIFFYDVDKAAVKEFALPKAGHITVATFYRLFLPALVPKGLKTLLYLDTDIVVIKNLMELYSKDLHSFPVAAVPDPGLSQPRPDLGISEASSYFNAGVLLINLKEWKEQKISENAIDFILQSSQGLIWGDQDALNAAAKDKWCRLDSKYNLTFFDIPPLLKKYDFPRYLEEKVIIHYTTQHKPWAKVCANRLRYLYEYYLALSPRASKKVKHHWNMKREWNAAKIRVREFIIDINMSRYLPKRVYENNQ